MKQKIKIVKLHKELENGKESHLYATVSQDVEPIKEGDWRMITDKESSLYGQFEQKKGNLPENDQWSKIIATTDNNLFSEDDIIPYTSLPRVQQSFLKEYVANSDGEYEVDYYNVMPQSNGTRTDGKIIDEIALDNSLNTLQVLKLNQDNTVNITSVEEKLYSRAEYEVKIKSITLKEIRDAKSIQHTFGHGTFGESLLYILNKLD
tara:strand:- start:1186 stop:1803 length:618 start_codon:yes stop_codon:yes gene_type:complete